MIRALALIVALSGCAGTFGAGKKPTALDHVNRIGLGLAEASLACDWHQTRTAAVGGWKQFHEANPMLGETPSAHHVDAYFALGMVATAIAYRALPRWARPALAIGVLAVQVPVIRNNEHMLGGVCAFSGGPTVDGSATTEARFSW